MGDVAEHVEGLEGCYIAKTREPEELAELLKKAADEKSPRAQTLLADLYERGVGVEKSEKEAVRYYVMAAKQGEPIAKKRLSQRKMQTDI